jgi:hypothetical protein
MQVLRMALPMARASGNIRRDIVEWQRLNSMIAHLNLPNTPWPEVKVIGQELVETLMKRMRHGSCLNFLLQKQPTT